MKKFFMTVLTAVFISGIGVAANAIHEPAPSEAPEAQVALPGPDADQLHDYITKHKPYRKWMLWPGKGKMYKGTEPHGTLLTTFTNDTAHWSIKKKKGMADGSIIVKENYTADKKIAGLTVMYKIKGYNPEAGDWFWAKYTPEGKAEVSGKVEACIGCHGKKKDNDYVMTGEIMKKTM
jgi:hypothetical protein